MSTLFTEAPAAKAETGKSSGDGHYYGYDRDAGKWFPLYAEGGTFGLAAAREMRAKGHIAVPSVTGIIGTMRKRMIEDWQMREAAKAALNHKPDDYATTDEWLDVVVSEAKNASRAAMDLGTRVHKAIEQSILGEDYDASMQVYVDGVRAKLVEAGIGDGLTAEECAGSLEHGVAGKFDIIHDATLTICDAKTRGHKVNKTKISRVPSYNSDEMQIAAGGFFKWGRRFFKEGRGIVFGVSTIQPGLVTPHVFTGPELIEPFSTFLALCQVWRFDNNFDPRIAGTGVKQ